MLKPKLLKYIEVLISNPLLPDTKCADMVGVSRLTLREWKKGAEFLAEYNSRLREIWADSERAAIETIQTLTREGDFKAAKYILDSLGYAPAQKVDANLTTVIKVTVDDDEIDTDN